MRFTPSILDEIKARIPVTDVVRRRVKLLKSGREWKGLSPFSAEKTPSFFVNDQKQAWFDFSSGQNGNIFDFLMKTEGLSFPEAVERLAAEAGVDLPKASEEAIQQEKRRASLHDVLELAAKFFEEQLQARGGAKARGYLADRGLGPSLQKQFRIGYAPNERFALRDWLAEKGTTGEQMVETGMLIHGEDIAVPYDRFRDRVMFPICDRAGKVIAFGGRALEKDVPAKYLNSPETPLFHKGHVVYNHHNARKAAHDAGTVIAVEGYVDVISMTAVGFGNVVAPLGTALTPDQCELLWRMAEEPILCFDGDRAGRKAAARAIDTALPLIGPGKSLRFAFLPDGQDPDDLARSGGHDAVASVLAAAKPLVEVLLQRELEAGPVDTPERRAALDKRINEALRQIADEQLRRYYREDIFRRIAAMMPGANAQRQNSYQQNRRAPFQPGVRGRFSGRQEPETGYRSRPVVAGPAIQRSAVFGRTGGLAVREAQILLAFAYHPDILGRQVEELAELDFATLEATRLRDGLVSCAALDPQDWDELRRALLDQGFGAALERVEGVTAMASLWSIRPEAASEDVLATLNQAMALHRRARTLHRELKSAEFALGQDPSEENFARLQDIKLELAGLDGREAALEGFGIMSGRPARSF
jgi:DNA primase